ncbi:nuclear transport factor 2 family protein [Niabella drilacis]|uniref:Ketosteroid isomerase-related protein n=1 Tax=Niabella drilacis (strain DSM 25811 / CCM 8410 / CCUG 62505 / LMG 26954 / E90) TaxID=1285928 RepID=A0A1G6NCY7_NIADE|nr:nuclear transport factor 2 family protein [Niabella drilacis]SDC65055.1 Ketosteroid isomerase-related protein [Niabella drilacis]
MENAATTTALLEHYYSGFAQKEGWETVLAEDFIFTGGDMTHPEPLTGKAAYRQVIDRFSRVFTTMRVKEMIVDGDKACVIGTYDYAFPNGVKTTGNVAEIWEARNGKLQALTIFFDTLTFQRNTPA